ncbi:MAG: hypothetical protein LBF40_03285 [Deltaproteobacteria bacterium]|jgi:hypothetical protein|nr:hypothetical protein [Deltaproteobacteria bacterium]
MAIPPGFQAQIWESGPPPVKTLAPAGVAGAWKFAIQRAAPLRARPEGRAKLEGLGGLAPCGPLGYRGLLGIIGDYWKFRGNLAHCSEIRVLGEKSGRKLAFLAEAAAGLKKTEKRRKKFGKKTGKRPENDGKKWQEMSRKWQKMAKNGKKEARKRHKNDKN